MKMRGVRAALEHREETVVPPISSARDTRREDREERRQQREERKAARMSRQNSGVESLPEGYTPPTISQAEPQLLPTPSTPRGGMLAPIGAPTGAPLNPVLLPPTLGERDLGESLGEPLVPPIDAPATVSPWEIAAAAAGKLMRLSSRGHVIENDAQAKEFVTKVAGEDNPNRKKYRGSIISDNKGIILPFDVSDVKEGECRPKAHYAIMKEAVVREANAGLHGTGSSIRLLHLGKMTGTDYAVVSPRWIHRSENPNTRDNSRHSYGVEMSSNQVSNAQSMLSILQHFTGADAGDYFHGNRDLTNPTFYPQGPFEPEYNSVIGFYKELFPEEELWTKNFKRADRLAELRAEYKKVPEGNKPLALQAAISYYIGWGFKPEADCSKTCFAVMGLAKDPPGGFSIDSNTEYKGRPDIVEVAKGKETGEAGDRMRKRLIRAWKKIEEYQDVVGAFTLGGMPGQCYNVFNPDYGSDRVAAVYHFAGIAARDGNAVVSVEAWADCGANANTQSAESWEMSFYQDRVDTAGLDDIDSDFKRGSFATVWWDDFDLPRDPDAADPTFLRVVAASKWKDPEAKRKFTLK